MAIDILLRFGEHNAEELCQIYDMINNVPETAVVVVE